MDRARHERIGELFRAACELEGDEREAYLTASGEETALLDEVRELLGHDAEPDPRLSGGEEQRGELLRRALVDGGTATAVEGGVTARPDGGAAPERIGPYRLLERIGAGGMGEVHAADQLEPVRRRVALKLIKRGMDSEQVVARFEAERQALARMSHPNVAQVFDGGTADDGRPYFVMEYVAGEPVTESCDRRKLTTRERVALFLDVCAGVQHAHQKGVVHRDLKPSNILVTVDGSTAVPKIIDFGVARAVTGRLAERTLHTSMGQVVGTLDYMSPEQADPTGVDVDTRSDIYSLGVVLYQLVSGLLPFDLATAEAVPLSVMQRTIREQDPPTPSTRLSRAAAAATAIADRRGTDERTLKRQLHGDLDWICLRCLEKDPARRYASAAELAADLRRFLAYEPVMAARPGAGYRLRKFVRRNRVGVAAGALVLAGLAAGVAGIVSGRLEAEARAEQLERQSAAWRVRPLVEESAALWPALPESIPVMERWVDQARGVSERLAVYREGETTDGDALSSFDDDPWLRELPADLDASLGALESELLAPGGLTEEHGPAVVDRLALARSIEASFAPGGEAHRRWAEVLPQIAAAHPELEDLPPQAGLLPLGRDPDSGRWEFAHLPSGEPPGGEPGAYVRDGDTGVVLVLVPGGELLMGSQGSDPDAPNFVPWSANVLEDMEMMERLHRVTVGASFLSKYEFTQAQWRRLMATEPAAPEYGLGPLLPVTNVSWNECAEACRRLGLVLPTEEQWEYAVRAGTTTRWWVGQDDMAPKGKANLHDRQPRESTSGRYPFADGIVGLAETGSFPANGNGLHNVIGNVTEWTSSVQDWGRKAEIEAGAPVIPKKDEFVARGGTFKERRVAGSRSGARFRSGPPTYYTPTMGFRPARALER